METEGGILMCAEDGTQVFVHPPLGSVAISTSAWAAREDTLSPLVPAESEECRMWLGGKGRFERRDGKGDDWEEETRFAPQYK